MTEVSLDRPAPRVSRTVYRGLAVVLSLGLIGLWIAFAWGIFSRSQMMPAPSGIMLPLFYCCLAAWATRAALKDEPVVLMIAGGLSLVPVGLLLLLMPGPSRWIAVVDVSLIALGFALLRGHPGPEPSARASGGGANP